jgi:hypothetical protein
MFLATLLAVSGCDDVFHDGDCEFCGMQQPVAFSIDLESAASLAILESSYQSNGFSGASTIVPDSEEGSGDQGNVVKLDDTGGVSPVLVEAQAEGTEGLSEEAKEQMGPAPTRPRVAAIGLAPTGEVYVLFEYPFIFRLVEDTGGLDPWSPSSPYTCQLFKAELLLEDALAGDNVAPMGPSNLECVTTEHQIPTWRRGRVMQFDRAGNLYFPAHIQGTDKEIFYSYDPHTGELVEKVNANICWRDVEVTPEGAIFYTGTTKVDGDCHGNSFFRYVANDNRLLEVSRGWWEYAFATEVDEDTGEERILFYGPDPDTSNGLPSWDSACVYRYDPTIEDPTARATRLTLCLNDIWAWIDARDLGGFDQSYPDIDLRLARQERCEADGVVFIGGSGISRLEQAADGTIYVLGEMQRKLGGDFHCSLEIEGGHCSSLDPAIATREACEDSGASWIESGWCDGPSDYYPTAAECLSAGGYWNSHVQWYDDAQGTACLVSETSVTLEQAERGAVERPGWRVHWTQCQAPNELQGRWTETIRGVASLDPAGDGESLPVLLTTSEEHAINFWVVERDNGHDVYVSSFATGRYLLSEATPGALASRRILLEEYEVYNLAPAPNHATRLMFDSLYFPTNSYRFGSIDTGFTDPEEVENSFEVTSGLTGRITTLIVVPEF